MSLFFKELAMSENALEKEFDKAMMSIHTRTRDETGYMATIFFQMLCRHKGVETARRLIHSKAPSDGYTALYEMKRLDLTVEALVCDNPKWQSLFEEETLHAARQRLEQYEYKFAGC
jgi:hypothetical protein